MNRPWHIWTVFGLSMVGLLAVMAWISVALLRLDRAEAEARWRAAVEEDVRLALWRMDSAATPLIAVESARPYFAYRAFYPADRDYSRMFGEIQPGETLVASPLLMRALPYILVHFQLDPNGTLTSPQIPEARLAGLPRGRRIPRDRVASALKQIDRLRSVLDRNKLLSALPPVDGSPTSRPVQALAQAPAQARQGVARQSLGQQKARSQIELNRRAQSVESNVMQQQQGGMLRPSRSGPRPTEGIMHPMWIDTTLILARRVSVNGRDYVQGCRLDWPALKRWLLDSVDDLFENADLVAVTGGQSGNSSRRLAALPVELVPGDVGVMAEASTSPIRASLVIAWACVLLAGIAVAVLLRGVVTLSERRGAFVSAVTHELRTPLTTFSIYTEMLSDGMVVDEAKRKEYVDTLRVESERLGHLVENVLAYARLERGSPAGRIEAMTVGEVFERAADRLDRHIRRADMTLAINVGQEMLDQSVRLDLGAVEQILFNLVDNACKYARSATDRRIHIEAVRDGGSVLLSVRDHGPGIVERDARRVFRPFSKSARDAAGTAPGVGLGLALSRRLARAMGGNLRIDSDAGRGARFVLVLPRADC